MLVCWAVMDLIIRNFTKLVILAAIVAILWFFKSKAAHYGIVKTESESGWELIGAGKEAHTKLSLTRLENGVHREYVSTQYASRGLKWLVNISKQDAGQGRDLFSEGNSELTLTDDPENDDCSEVHKKPMADRCSFVNRTGDCHIDEGFIDYTLIIYCDFNQKLLPLAVTILILWWLFLFIGLAVTADDFFCPALSVISDTMRLSHNVAGVTFMAFGNGAPDIFSAIAAIGNAKDGDAGLAIGALFGAGVFVTTVVAGVIAIIHPFDAMQRPFLRDIIFYLAAVFWTFVVLWDKKITKMEAIGFILLYVVYVLTVVIGRYIYTRRRSRNVTTYNIQESSGISVVSQLDTASDERQPLLSNPDVISLTAVRAEGAWPEFLRAINPVESQLWSGMSLPKKLYAIFKCPIVFLLKVTVPVVNFEDDKHNWNRHLTCLQCILGPVFSVLATKVGFTLIGGAFPVWGLTLVLSVLLAAVVFFTSVNELQPRYHAAFAYLGFVVAVIWIYSIANEIVNILQAFGVVFNISNAILGLTLLAWGNSIGDFIADTVMARQGYPRMGISACFGGPLFNLLLGIGIPFTIATVKKGDYAIQITLEEVVLAAFLALSLVSSLLIVPLSRFRMSRGWGIYLVILYIVFLAAAILTETGVFHAYINTGA